MQTSIMDEVLWFGAFAGELLLVLVLLYRRRFRHFPVFLASVVVQVVNDPVLYWVSAHQSRYAYAQAYTIFEVLDYMLQLGVILEIGHAVLYPTRQRMSNRSLTALSTLLLVGFGLTLMLVFGRGLHGNTGHLTFRMLQQMNFGLAALRLILFATLAGFSQMLGITWRNQVLRLAAGLAFYSATFLVAQLAIAHLPAGNHLVYQTTYDWLRRVQVIGYLGALYFWVWSFLQKDAPRREFTPQMQQFLVTISQTARRSRLAFARNSGHKS